MPAPNKALSPHRWRFFRAGGVDQVRLERGADILNLADLDQKLWVALSCPVKGLEFDEKTLALLDADGDGYVRPPEILAVVEWLGEVLQNADDLVKGEDRVTLASLRQDTAEGKRLLASARHVLASLGNDKATVITIADTQKTAEVFAKAKFNGDGVVPPAIVEVAAARQVAQDILDCLGGVTDRSGQPGIAQQQLEQFFADCAAYDAWYKQGEGDKSLMPLGADTPAAADALQAVRAKVDDFFGRSRLAAYDARALTALNKQETAYLEIAAMDMTITAQEVENFPLALVEANKALPLVQGMNPAWASRLGRLRALCCAGKNELTEADWAALVAKFAAYEGWAAGKQGGSVEKLGIARVRAILASKTKDALAKVIAEDVAVADEIAAIAQVEKLCYMHRDLKKLLENYVSFTDFYARRGAIFQAGTLHFDGRTCDLTFKVNDAGKHGTLAPMSKTYLAYVDCTRPGSEKMSVAAAFTAGDSDNLFVGRNGLFYDRKGRDWNATITKIVDNPISIGQAFFSPYKKLLRWIEETVAKRAAAADADASVKLQGAATSAGDAAATGKAAPAKKMDIGVLAAISVAIGGVTTALGGIMAGFFGLGYLMPLGILGLILLISGPSMVIAWLKLRQRNLGPILDANGWAVNTLTKVNIPLGRSLTDMPVLPKGSERSLVDPYAPKKSAWPKVILVLLILGGVGYGLYHYNYLHEWTKGWVPEGRKEVGMAPNHDSGAPGATIEIEVKSDATELTVAYEGGPSIGEGNLPVAGHKATLTIPADAKVGSRIIVKDKTVLDNQFAIQVITPPAAK